MTPHWRLHTIEDGRIQPQFLDAAGQVMLIVPAEHAYRVPWSAEAAVFRLADQCSIAAMHWHGIADWRKTKGG